MGNTESYEGYQFGRTIEPMPSSALPRRAEAPTKRARRINGGPQAAGKFKRRLQKRIPRDIQRFCGRRICTRPTASVPPLPHGYMYL